MTGTIQGQITGNSIAFALTWSGGFTCPKILARRTTDHQSGGLHQFFQRRAGSGSARSRGERCTLYEAYTSVAEVLNNQKRQMIGQTIVHVLIEYLKTLPSNSSRTSPARCAKWNSRIRSGCGG